VLRRPARHPAGARGSCSRRNPRSTAGGATEAPRTAVSMPAYQCPSHANSPVADPMHKLGCLHGRRPVRLWLLPAAGARRTPHPPCRPAADGLCRKARLHQDSRARNTLAPNAAGVTGGRCRRRSPTAPPPTRPPAGRAPPPCGPRARRPCLRTRGAGSGTAEAGGGAEVSRRGARLWQRVCTAARGEARGAPSVVREVGGRQGPGGEFWAARRQETRDSHPKRALGRPAAGLRKALREGVGPREVGERTVAP
jgi:hypothetical protein